MTTRRWVTAAVAAVAFVGATLAAVGCGQQQSTSQTPPASESAAATAQASTQPVEITLKTDPDPARTGENTFEAMVMQDGKPVTDATVSTELFMAAMPAMKMPEMRNTVDLTHEGNGMYRGRGQVMMAGSWDVTVMVMRGGQEIGSQKVTLTAK
ncbi:MAG: FixH family protein [Vicinamibacterales bacterium]